MSTTSYSAILDQLYLEEFPEQDDLLYGDEEIEIPDNDLLDSVENEAGDCYE